jgi:hypothetical protein
VIHEEFWRVISEFPEYQISNLGRIIHKDRPNTTRKININHQGFPTVVLFDKEHSGSRYVRQVNKIVATTFLEPPRSGHDAVWHIDGDLQNCHADNLKWDMRARVLEWNEMNRVGQPRLRTPPVMHAATGKVFANAYEAGLHFSELETSIVKHIESYPEQYQDRARYRYVDA